MEPRESKSIPQEDTALSQHQGSCNKRILRPLTVCYEARNQLGSCSCFFPLISALIPPPRGDLENFLGDHAVPSELWSAPGTMSCPRLFSRFPLAVECRTVIPSKKNKSESLQTDPLHPSGIQQTPRAPCLALGSHFQGNGRMLSGFFTSLLGFERSRI